MPMLNQPSKETTNISQILRDALRDTHLTQRSRNDVVDSSLTQGLFQFANLGYIEPELRQLLRCSRLQSQRRVADLAGDGIRKFSRSSGSKTTPRQVLLRIGNLRLVQLFDVRRCRCKRRHHGSRVARQDFAVKIDGRCHSSKTRPRQQVAQITQVYALPAD